MAVCGCAQANKLHIISACVDANPPPWRFAVATAHLIHSFRGHSALGGRPVEAFKTCLFRKQLTASTIHALATREIHSYVCGSVPIMLSFPTQSITALWV